MSLPTWHSQARVQAGSPLATRARAALGGVVNPLSPAAVLWKCAVGRGPTELCWPFPQDELEHSVGESAAQGAAGVVLWVSWEDTQTKVSSGPGRGFAGGGGTARLMAETLAHPFHPGPGWPAGKYLSALSGAVNSCGVPDAPLPTQESCQAIKKYMDTTLGPFILNVTSGALLCSQVLCSGHGRCARHPSHPEALLILNPASFSIQLTPGGSPLSLRGALSLEDRVRMATEFKCRCYPGWKGARCEHPGV